MKVLAILLLFFFSLLQAQKPYNLAFIMIDDQNIFIPPYYPSYTGSIFPEMTKNAHVFHRAIASTPICLPSRAAILFGRDSYISGIHRNKQSYLEKFPKHETLMEFLVKQNYQVGVFGKILHGSETGKFVRRNDLPSTNNYKTPTNNLTVVRHKADLEVFAKKYIDHVYIDKRLHIREIIKGGLTDMRSAKQARRFLRQRDQDKPFGLFYGTFRPHMAYFFKDYQNIRKKFLNKLLTKFHAYINDTQPAFTSRTYNPFFERIMAENKLDAFVDAYLKNSFVASKAISIVYRELQKQELLNNTMIVVTSDHGFHLGDLKMWAKGDVKMLASRKPLWITLPGQQKRHDCHKWVSSASLFHTIRKHLEITERPFQELNSRDLLKCSNEPVISVDVAQQEHALFWKKYQYLFTPNRQKGTVQKESLFLHSDLTHLHPVDKQCKINKYRQKALDLLQI